MREVLLTGEDVSSQVWAEILVLLPLKVTVEMLLDDAETELSQKEGTR
jgi:hypothetical protein